MNTLKINDKLTYIYFFDIFIIKKRCFAIYISKGNLEVNGEILPLLFL